MTTRLEKLRAKLSLEWGELATHLGISRSMLDQVRKGTRSPGPKLVRRISDAERAAGIGGPSLYETGFDIHHDSDRLREHGQPQSQETPTRPKVWDLSESEHERWLEERPSYETREKIKVSPQELRALASSLIKDAEALLQRARDLEKLMKEQEP